MRNVLITGANGFIGRAVMARFLDEGCGVRGSVRSESLASQNENFVFVPDLSDTTDWSLVLKGINTVVHTAARVHVMNDLALEPLTEYRKINLNGTIKLANQCVEAGVERFVFLSSVKVCGERTEVGVPFKIEDDPAPVDPYGISKMETERELFALAQDTNLEIVVIRPPLVYGPGVKANFRNMMLWIDRGFPLPLGSINNKRSLVALDNLVDFIITCSVNPNAGNNSFFVSDGDDVSTPELVRYLSQALGRNSRIFSLPEAILALGAKLIGKEAAFQRLCGSLQVDISRSHSVLGWKPLVSIEEGMKRVANGYLDGRA